MRQLQNNYGFVQHYRITIDVNCKFNLLQNVSQIFFPLNLALFSLKVPREKGITGLLLYREFLSSINVARKNFLGEVKETYFLHLLSLNFGG